MKKDKAYVNNIECSCPITSKTTKPNSTLDSLGFRKGSPGRPPNFKNVINIPSSDLVFHEGKPIEDIIKSSTEGVKTPMKLHYNPQDKVTMIHSDLSSDSLVCRSNIDSKYDCNLIKGEIRNQDIPKTDILEYMNTQFVEKKSSNYNASSLGGNHNHAQSIFNQRREESPGLPKRSMVKVSFRNERRDSNSQKIFEVTQGMMSNKTQGASSDLCLQPSRSQSINYITSSKERKYLSSDIVFSSSATDNSVPLQPINNDSVLQRGLFRQNILQCDVGHVSEIHNSLSEVNNTRRPTQTELFVSSMAETKHDQSLLTQSINWIQNPILFYLSESLIKLHELRTKIRDSEISKEAFQNLEVSDASCVTPDSDYTYECQAKMETLKRYVTYSISEIDGILLNPLFTSWSERHLRNLLKRVSTSWRLGGLESKDFEEASLLLLQAISEERRGTIRYTQIYRLREYFGSHKRHSTGFCLLSIMTIASLLFTVLLAVLGNNYYLVRILLPVLLVIAMLFIFCFSFLILNHNASAVATVAFLKMELLYLSNGDVSLDSEDSFSSSRVLSEPSIYPSNEHIIQSGTLHVTDEGVRPNKDTFFELNTLRKDESTSISIIKKPLHRAQMENQKHPEHAKGNDLPTQSHAFEEQHSVEHSQQIPHRMGTINTTERELSTSDGQSLNTNKGSKIIQTHNFQDSKAYYTAIDSTFIIDLADNISVTALIYCKDEYALSTMMSSLWEFNFLVLRTDVMQIDNVYQQGSDKFKIIILHTPDLPEGSSEFNTASSWVKENLPVFFFSCDNRKFPYFVPSSNKLQLPLSAKNITNLLLFGTAKNEGLCSTKMGSTSKHLKVPLYTLGRRLGGGAYGNVFEAEMEETGVMCAVKRIYLRNNDNTDQDNNYISQLRDIAREVEIMSSLMHPNIVQYMFFERDDNCISIFMELCLGGSLSSMINSGELVDTEFIKQVLRDIISAVAYLHKKKVTHRDLKPDNVLFSNGRAKLTDFGTAILKRNRDNLSPVTGTFAYMAPEIILCETYGKACDMWSIGCIAAEVLKVDLPQRSLGLPGMCEFYRKMDVNSSLSIDCSVLEVSDFLRSCLQRNPNTRPTAAELLHHDCLKHNNVAFDKWIKEAMSRKCLSYQPASFAMDLFGSSESDINLDAQLDGLSLKSFGEPSNI
ncbi:unnamed protein product [Phytomonas sp. Hart1]|nr:unnamed protein product [Phytomonas sp. Hart1]|eukprot:CCW70428.1 unnamed protein product [Phytomonas sp. isolate Hart1]